VEREDEESNKVRLSMAESGTAKNGTRGEKGTHGRNSTGTVPHPKYIEIHRVHRWATGARAHCCQDLRDFRDRDDVTPERLLTLRGGASAVTSLSISTGVRRLVVPPCFLEGFDPAASLAEARLVRVDRLPAGSSASSSSSSVSSGTTSAFALPLPLPLLLVPVSTTTVVLVEDADEEERARLELPPAAETAVDDPEENEGDLSRVRRTEEREDAGFACAFLPKASLLRARDVPA
jgi:hypothetical protein